jgi:hypothetical protein
LHFSRNIRYHRPHRLADGPGQSEKRKWKAMPTWNEQIEAECDISRSRSALVAFLKFQSSECVTSSGVRAHALAKCWPLLLSGKKAESIGVKLFADSRLSNPWMSNESIILMDQHCKAGETEGRYENNATCLKSKRLDLIMNCDDPESRPSSIAVFRCHDRTLVLINFRLQNNRPSDDSVFASLQHRRCDAKLSPQIINGFLTNHALAQTPI